MLDPATGVIKKVERYDDKTYKAQLLGSIYALHTGSYWGLPGRVLVTVASLTMPLFFITGWLLYLDRRRKKRQIKQARQGVGAANTDAPSWLIGFASQSGFAEQLAWQTAGQLQAAGLPVRVEPLGSVSQQDLQQASNALFVVSTFGDGEAPDSARGFERKILGQPLGLETLKYSVLALGDRQYPHFCGFATRIAQWLNERGAQSLFTPVQVDSGDPQAIQHWQQQLGQLTGVAPSGQWKAAVRKLVERLGVAVSDFDVIELNEAFASQGLAVLRELGLADDAPQVNPNGGAIALGHPLGMSGARIVMTALHQLEKTGGKKGLATMCVGVGQGLALAIERV